jgi:ATP/maltotriose-dependent transcriptional regulator MalT
MKREIEVLILIIDGLNNDLMPIKLFLSALTICTHHKNVFSKLKLKNTAMFVKNCCDYPEQLEYKISKKRNFLEH